MFFGNQHNLKIELVICWLRAQYVVSKSTLSNCLDRTTIYVFVLFVVILLKTVYIKQLSDWVFVFIRNDQGLGTFITYLNLDSWFRISQKPHPSMQISNTYRYLAGRIE